MSYETLKVNFENRVLTVTLARPPINQINLQMLQELTDIFETQAAELEVGAIVITGTGETFASGADAASFAEHGRQAAPHPSNKLANKLYSTIESYPKGVVAAINGLAQGGGNELAMACDYRVAATTATFRQPEILVGLIPGWGGLQRLPRLVGRGRALEMMLTGQILNAHEARFFGLATEVVEPERLLARARETAERFAAQAPISLKMIKQRLTDSENQFKQQALQTDEECFNEILRSADAQEGIKAWTEGRQPQWKGQ